MHWCWPFLLFRTKFFLFLSVSVVNIELHYFGLFCAIYSELFELKIKQVNSTRGYICVCLCVFDNVHSSRYSGNVEVGCWPRLRTAMPISRLRPLLEDHNLHLSSSTWFLWFQVNFQTQYDLILNLSMFSTYTLLGCQLSPNTYTTQDTRCVVVHKRDREV